MKEVTYHPWLLHIGRLRHQRPGMGPHVRGRRTIERRHSDHQLTLERLLLPKLRQRWNLAQPHHLSHWLKNFDLHRLETPNLHRLQHLLNFRLQRYHQPCLSDLH